MCCESISFTSLSAMPFSKACVSRKGGTGGGGGGGGGGGILILGESFVNWFWEGNFDHKYSWKQDILTC